MRKYEKGNQVYRAPADSELESYLKKNGFKEVSDEAKPIEKMTNSELANYAKVASIDLTGAMTKTAMIAAIKAAQEDEDV